MNCERKYTYSFYVNCFFFSCIIKGDTAVDGITEQEASGSSSALNTDDSFEPPAKKKSAEQWKEKYFKSIVDVESKSSDAAVQKSTLKAYHTLLQCIQMEKQMKLKHFEISYLRSTISPTLNEYPNHLTSYTVEDVELN